jgi:hypothetical protein
MEEDTKITLFVEKSQFNNPNYKKHLDDSKPEPKLEIPSIQKTQEVPLPEVKLNLDEITISIFDNPILNQVMFTFFEFVSQKLGYKGQIYFFFNPIHYETFISEMEKFGRFNMDRLNEFCKVVISIMVESKRKECDSTHFIKFIIKKIHSQQPIKSIPKEFLKDVKFKNMLIWLAQTMVKTHYLEYLMTEFKIITLKIQPLLEPLNLFEFLQHGLLRKQFGELIYIDCALEGNKLKTKWEKEKHIKYKTFLENTIPKFLFISTEEIKTNESRIYFSEEGFLLANEVFLNQLHRIK